MAKKLTTKTIANVVANIQKLDKADQKVILTKWNDVLDDLLSDDFFGTEGQTDPRGDHRNTD